MNKINSNKRSRPNTTVGNRTIFVIKLDSLTHSHWAIEKAVCHLVTKAPNCTLFAPISVGNFSLKTTQELQLHCPTFFMGSAGFLVNRTPKYSLVSKLLQILQCQLCSGKVSGFQVPFVGHMPYPHNQIQISERFLKHGLKFLSVLGGYFVSMNILPRKEAGYYAYSLIVGEKLCLLVV